MKDNLIEKLFRDAKQARLEKEKKNSIRESVLVFVKENPLPAPQRAWFLRPAFVTVFGLAVVLVVGSMASVQAQSALPGDPLYSVKVGFNEKVLQVLAFSDEAKVNLSVQLAELRLEEAETLVAQGRITQDNQAEINSNFNAQAKRVAEKIDKLNNARNYSDAEKISSDFEASLKAHSQVLSALGGSNFLINEVNSATAKALSSSAVSIDSAGLEPDARVSALEKIAQNRLESAQESVDELRDLIENQKDKIGAEDLVKAEENLKKAEEKIAEGKDKMDGGDKEFAKALSLFQEARIIAKKSERLIEVKTRLRINIDIDLEGND